MNCFISYSFKLSTVAIYTSKQPVTSYVLQYEGSHSKQSMNGKVNKTINIAKNIVSAVKRRCRLVSTILVLLITILAVI